MTDEKGEMADEKGETWSPSGMLAVSTQYTNVSDRQTPHDGIGRAGAIAFRGKNARVESVERA